MRYLRTCDKCQKAREFAIFPTEPLRPIICLEPFEIVTVDYSGPYETCRGYHYCLYIIDNFTGWLVFPTRKADGETTKKALIAYSYRFGYPRVLHSDRGSHFDNETCLEWSRESGIKWVFGGPGVAKSQGQVGRSIKAIVAKVKPYIPKDEVHGSIRSFDLQVNAGGHKRTIVVETGHGLIAHRMLLHWLENLQEEDIVTIAIHH
jgi:transposase InsO family protein